jgi:hypothetical protein
MRRAKGPLDEKAGARCEQAGDGVHGGGFQRLVERQRWQNPGHPARHHRLAGPWCADEQQIVTAGRRDLERAPGEQLSANVRQVQRAVPCRGRRRYRSGRHHGSRLVERAHRVDKRRHREHVESGDDRRFAGVRRRQEDAGEPVTPGGSGDGQNTAGAVNRAVERQLAEQHQICDVPPLHDAGGRENTKGNRQVEGRPDLGHVGRGQVDRDLVRWKLEAGIADRAPHAIAAFADARVGQADHRERREAERHVDFHVDGAGVYAEHSGRPQAREHGRRFCKMRRAVSAAVFSTSCRAQRVALQHNLRRVGRTSTQL